MALREARLLLVLLAGCVHRATIDPEAERARVLAEADARWAARATGDNLDTAVQLWMGRLAVDPDDPVALARLARAEWTRGQLDPPSAIERFETGQDYGWRCLLGWPAFAATLDAGGYRVTPEAAAALPPPAASCALWTVVGGLSVVGVRGAGASLELDGVGHLLARLRELEPAAPDLDPGFLDWAEARLLVLAAAPDPPPPAARARFADAIAEEPGVLLFRRDLAAAFPDTRNVALEGFAPPSPDTWALENAAWGREEGSGGR